MWTKRISKAESTAQHSHIIGFITQKKFKRVENFQEHYQLLEKLGSGGFGTVHSGLHRRSNVPCAIKVIEKESLYNDRRIELNKNELELLEEIDHPQIVRTYELMEDQSCFYIIMEVMRGGTLMDKIGNSRSGFNEHKAASVIHQLLRALNYMHERNIMHRDLKPENILCEDLTDLGEDDLQIKVADFGLSTKYDPQAMRNDACGTYRFFAPELCRCEPFDSKIDVWAVGCIAYILIAQKYPWYDRSNVQN